MCVGCVWGVMGCVWVCVCGVCGVGVGVSVCGVWECVCVVCEVVVCEWCVQGVWGCVCACAFPCTTVVCVASPVCECVQPCSGGTGYLSGG